MRVSGAGQEQPRQLRERVSESRAESRAREGDLDGESSIRTISERCSDEDLMALWVTSRRAGRGHDLAFRLLWERHAGGVLREIERALGTHRALADEVFQEAWSEVTAATSYTPGVFRAFIRTIAVRKALDRRARASRTSVLPGATDDAAEPDAEWPADASDPAQAAQARQGARLILELAATLPQDQRRAWVLRFVEQFTFEEIAASMGTPVGTAKTRVRIASASIRRGLQSRGIAWGDLADEPALDD